MLRVPKNGLVWFALLCLAFVSVTALVDRDFTGVFVALFMMVVLILLMVRANR